MMRTDGLLTQSFSEILLADTQVMGADQALNSLRVVLAARHGQGGGNESGGESGYVPITEGSVPISAGSGNGSELPPNDNPPAEYDENGREIIGQANFRDYYDFRQSADQDRNPPEVYGIEAAVTAEGVLGDTQGYFAQTIIREMRNNYYKHCKADIDSIDEATGKPKIPTDSGKRIIRITRDSSGRIYLDYEDDDEVTSNTFNIYAGYFGQPLEEWTENEVSAIWRPRIENWRELSSLEKENELDKMLAHGNELTSGKDGDGGRGIPLMLDAAIEASIVRRGRGAHLQIIFKSEEELARRIEARAEISLAQFDNLDLTAFDEDNESNS